MICQCGEPACIHISHFLQTTTTAEQQRSNQYLKELMYCSVAKLSFDLLCVFVCVTESESKLSW